MQKDVIYIDVEDDITAIIGKVKSSKSNIVALVPPKRIGVLQSAVNLQLLARLATKDKKRLVVITGNQALAGLAASASIPVAKNLQSKPEMAEIPALDIDDGDEIIDGEQIPIGEHAAQAEPKPVSAADGPLTSQITPATPPAAGSDVKPKVKKGSKVPNFDTFRKKLVLIGLAVLLLVGFLIWALFFAPRATVVLAARTVDAAINQPVNLSASAETSAKDNIIRAATEQFTQDVSVDFAATGKKEVGEKATGEVRFRNSSRDSQTLPSGTSFTVNGLTFKLLDAVTVPAESLGYDCPGLRCPGSANGEVEAAEPGTKYNAADGNLSGGPDGVSAGFTDATTGGTDKTVTVFTQSDIDKAKAAADKEIDETAAISALKDQFEKGVTVIEESLQVGKSDLRTDATADSEGGKATYGGTVTFTMYGVADDELKDYLMAVIEQQFDDKNEQRVYESGAKDVKFADVKPSDNGVSTQISTNGKIGPKIDDQQIKQQARGKKYGEIQSSLESVNGVSDVDVKFWPFWVSTAPDNVKKISVEFNVDE